MKREASVDDIAPGGRTLSELWERRDPTQGASEAVYQTLHEAIVTGVLPAGSRLAEEDLAGHFTVSRTPVREAVLRLEAERLAERNSRGGLIVASVTPEEILEIYLVRQTLDGLAAKLAAETARPADISRLRWLNEQIRDSIGSASIPELARINLSFHDALYRAAQNVFLLEMITTAHDRVRRFPGTTLSSPDRPVEVVAEHEAIIAAIESRIGDDAERLARVHMAHAMNIRIDLLREHMTSSFSSRDLRSAAGSGKSRPMSR